jgi:cytochrome c553
MIHQKKISVIAAMAIFVMIGVAAHQPETAQQDGFKNLKVLPKDISHDSLKALMHEYSEALGVHCNFCHAPNKDNPSGWPDFASDDKPEKEIARHMMTMTSSINKTYFNWMNSTQPDTIRVVSCVTCHHGNPHPDEVSMQSDYDHKMQPPPPGMAPPPPPPGNDPGQH